VEGDAKLVVETLLKNTDDVSWDIAGIISDALVLASSFSSCKFGWIKRDGNTVAHMLAKFSSQSKLVVCNNELQGGIFSRYNGTASNLTARRFSVH
jgi:hypothetical protein